MSKQGGTKRDLIKTIEGLQHQRANNYDLLREVERRARFVVMMRENGLKHEPAWNELVKALNALRESDASTEGK